MAIERKPYEYVDAFWFEVVGVATPGLWCEACQNATAVVYTSVCGVGMSVIEYRRFIDCQACGSVVQVPVRSSDAPRGGYGG